MNGGAASVSPVGTMPSIDVKRMPDLARTVIVVRLHQGSSPPRPAVGTDATSNCETRFYEVGSIWGKCRSRCVWVDRRWPGVKHCFMTRSPSRPHRHLLITQGRSPRLEPIEMIFIDPLRKRWRRSNPALTWRYLPTSSSNGDQLCFPPAAAISATLIIWAVGAIVSC